MARNKKHRFKKVLPVALLLVIFSAGMLGMNFFKAKADIKNFSARRNANIQLPHEIITAATPVNNSNKHIADNSHETEFWKEEKIEEERMLEEKAARAHQPADPAVEPVVKPAAEPSAAPQPAKPAPQPVKPVVQPVKKPAPAVQPPSPPVPVSSKPLPGGKRTVYLTFDDGPAAFSGEIISLLDQYHAKATFFMLDGNMRRYPGAVQLMVKDGQSVGMHGVTHDKKKFYASSQSVVGEMNQAHNTLKEISGVDSRLIRTPYGSAPLMTPAYKQAVAQANYLMWDWNIDSKDWFYRDQRYVDSVIAQLQKYSGKSGTVVILLHERKETLQYLPKLLNYLASQNVELKALNSSMAPIHF